MATLLWQRDMSSDIDGVKNTFSSWDSCMSKAYCKWPVIVGIIIGSLIILSLVWCLARCLCCGAECCCGCLACCNSCCPSPREGRRRDDGYYQQPPPQPVYQQPYQQYQSAQPPPMYASGGGYRGGGYGQQPAQTATFDAPGKNGAAARYNEDALPAMPSWDHAASKHVEEEPEDVEMEKLDHPQAQQQALLPKPDDDTRYYGDQLQDASAGGDLGNINAGGPYHDYDQHQQFVGSPTSTARHSTYPPTYHTDYISPTSTVYEPARQQWGGGGYAPSVPPSYRTGAPSVSMSPPPQNPAIGRKPVRGSWRDV